MVFTTYNGKNADDLCESEAFRLNEYFSYAPDAYPGILENCIRDARKRYPEYILIADIRMWTQKWPNTSCGFMRNEPPGWYDTLSPTVVIKFDKRLRLVYHDSEWAYDLKGETTVQFYGAVRGRRLPGVTDEAKRFLVNGAQ